MKKLEKFINTKLYIPFATIVVFMFWLFCFLSKNEIINIDIINKLENIEFVILGLIFCFLLSMYNNSFYIIPFLVLIPFVFARPFDAYTTPICIYIGLSLFILGIILNFIIYKPKMKVGSFFIGLSVLGVAVILGGLLTKASYLKAQIMFSILCFLGLLVTYTFLSSTSSADFNEIARVFTYLGIFLLMQIITFYAIQENIIDSLLKKTMNVGWGSTNNIGLMLLMTIPFTIYLAISKKTWETILYLFLATIQVIALVLTYSRGSIASMIIGLIIYLPICLFHAKDKLTLICTFNILCLLVFFLISYISKYYPDYYSRFYEYVFKIDLDSINGRVPIYEKIMEIYKEHPIFGYGMFAPFAQNESEVITTYEWGHSTLLHTLYTMGFVGVGCLFYHLFEKYFRLLKKPNIKKTAILFSLAMSGLYGLFDVSYYFICYMVVLIILLAIVENETKGVSLGGNI